MFPSEWYECSKHQLEVIVDEVKYWDGYISKGSTQFFTTVKENADFIQFAMTSLGHKASMHVDDRRGLPQGKYVRKSICYTVHMAQGSKCLGLQSDARGKIEIKPTKASDGYKYCFTVPSGMLVLRRNNCINITGNSGKTSFLYQLICQALDQEKNCWVYSKELPAWMSRNWLMYLLAGRRHLVEYVSPEGATYYRVKPEAKKKISDFYRGKLMLYKDDWSNDVKSIQDSMIDSVRKYGSKLFLLDNMTTIDLCANDDNKWQKQTELVNWLIQFSMKYNVCTILVCHPRKMQDLTENVGLYELSGTANLINLAHRAISLRRIGKKEKAGIPNARGDGWVKPPCPYDVVVSVQKDRLRGRANLECGLYYDVPSRRFFTKPEEFEHNYAWDTTEYIDHVPYPVVDTEEEIFGK